jgi:hypothetical protein
MSSSRTTARPKHRRTTNDPPRKTGWQVRSSAYTAAASAPLFRSEMEDVGREFDVATGDGVGDRE